MSPSPWQRLASRLLVAVLVPAQVAVSVPVAAEEAVVADAEQATPAPTPRAVKPNRSLPRVEPVPLRPVFSASPTREELFRARVFEEPLIPLGPDSPSANVALAQALSAYLQRARRDDFGALETFLRDHPSSPWRGSLLANLGSVYRRSGYLSKALEAWEEALALSEPDGDPGAGSVADDAIAELMDLNMHLGRTEELEKLFSRIEGRDVRGSAAEKVATARMGLWILRKHHQDAVPSGPTALDRIMALGKAGHRTHAKIAAFHATPEGATLAEMKSLSDAVGMRMQMAFRERGAALALPAMVHFKVGHFAAAVKEEGGRVLLHDPILGQGHIGEFWVSRAVLDEETSGFALVRQGLLPAGWREASRAEAGTIRGRCLPRPPSPDLLGCFHAQVGQTSSEDCCGGMPGYGFYANLASLHIRDVPVGYAPPRGPEVRFGMSYNQRDAAQPQVFSYSNLGPKWGFDWMSFIVDSPGAPQDGAALHLGGGGVYRFYLFNGSTYAPQEHSRAVLALASSSPIRYELRKTDGSIDVFAQADSVVSSPRRVFLTESIDPQGNKLTFTYDASLRLVAVTDAIEQVTTLSYEWPSDPLKITKVTDPFGRSAKLTYDNQERLHSIEDVIGLTSRFTYGSSDFVIAMTTPYGTTTFDKGELNWEVAHPEESALSRWVEATDPLGAKERLEYVQYGAGLGLARTEPASVVPAGFESYNAGLDKYTSFFWDKRAMAMHPGDYSKARLFQWFGGGRISSEKRPLENRVWYLHIWDSNFQLPTGLDTARVLDDGSTQLTRVEYNARGLRIKAIDPLGRETRYTYGTSSTPDPDPATGTGIDLLKIEQKNPASPSGWDLVESRTHNSQHEKLSRTDAGGQTTSYTYLPNGQLHTVVTPPRNGPNGQPLTVAERTTTYAYYLDTAPTGAGQLQTITGPSTPQGSPVTSYTYDGYGRMRTTTDSDNYSLTVDYDALDRPTRIAYPDGTYEETVYSRLDPERRRDRLGRWSHVFYDALRRVVAVRDSLGRTSTQQWCTCGSLDKLIDANGNATAWERDVQGRVTREVRPDNAAWEYTYENTTSRLKQRKDSKLQVTGYEYFLDDSLKQITYSGALVPTSNVSFTYDLVYNRRSTMTDGTGVTSYGYHPVTVPPALGAGHLASVDGPLSDDAVSYAYDEIGRIASRGLSGFASTLTYDALDRLTKHGTPVGDFTSAYDGRTRRLLSLTYPNGQATQHTYFPNSGDHRLQEVKHLAPGSSLLSKYNYTYDAQSNVRTWTQQVGAAAAKVYELGYDAADQLTSATLKTTDPTPVTLKRYGYAYDLAGNRTAEQVDDSVFSATHNNRNQATSRQAGGALLFRGTVSEPATVSVQGQPTQVAPDNRFEGSAQVPSGTSTVTVVAQDYAQPPNVRTNTYQLGVSGATTNFSYDSNGNLTGDGTKTFEWDAENRLTAVKQGASVLASFAYDGQGRRVQKVAGGVTRAYVYDAEDIVEERLSSGQTLRYVHGRDVDQPLAQRDGAGVVSYYLADHLGSIVQTTNSAGAPMLAREYDPWGTLLQGSGTSGYAFTGREWDAETSLHYYRARYYDPRIARFISEDPIGFEGGMNFFAYVMNNPAGFVDPFGLRICWRIKWHNGPNDDVTCADRDDPPTCVQDGNCDIVPEPPPPARTCSGQPCTPYTDWGAFVACLMYNGPKPSTFYAAPKTVTGGGLFMRCHMAAQFCREGGIPCLPGLSGPGTPEIPFNQQPKGPAGPGWHGK